MSVQLYGFHYSVYLRVARLALFEKGVECEEIEVNPFVEDMPQDYLALHPFRRVPTLVDDGFVLYETQAITRYVDEAFPGPPLQPDDPHARARMAQVMSIVDHYAYWPMVRQVYSQKIFRPAIGEDGDEADYRAGLEASERVLGALEAIAHEGLQLDGADISLADLHLAPMMAYFTMAPEAARLLEQYPKLII